MSIGLFSSKLILIPKNVNKSSILIICKISRDASKYQFPIYKSYKRCIDMNAKATSELRISINKFLINNQQQKQQQQRQKHLYKTLNLSKSYSLNISEFISKSNFYHQVHFYSSSNTLRNSNKMSYNIDTRGPLNSTDYRVFFKDSNGKHISPWHDIPLYADKSQKTFNMVVEIPRWTQAKMEIATNEPLSPIKQDIKKGALRYVKNVFPHRGYIWNYGAFPQTWENPEHVDKDTQAKGDNDPIDVLEIGSRVAKRGDILQVKILGTVALIDEGETDWKVLTIDINDPLASEINDIADVKEKFPGLLSATIEWFKIYKIPDGKPPNKFAFDGEAKDREFATKVVEETHTYWKELMNKGHDKLDTKNTTLADSNTIDVEKAKSIVEARPSSDSVEPKQIEDQLSLDKWHFVKL